MNRDAEVAGAVKGPLSWDIFRTAIPVAVVGLPVAGAFVRYIEYLADPAIPTVQAALGVPIGELAAAGLIALVTGAGSWVLLIALIIAQVPFFRELSELERRAQDAGRSASELLSSAGEVAGGEDARAEMAERVARWKASVRQLQAETTALRQQWPLVRTPLWGQSRKLWAALGAAWLLFVSWFDLPAGAMLAIGFVATQLLLRAISRSGRTGFVATASATTVILVTAAIAYGVEPFDGRTVFVEANGVPGGSGWFTELARDDRWIYLRTCEGASRHVVVAPASSIVRVEYRPQTAARRAVGVPELVREWGHVRVGISEDCPAAR